MILTTDQLRSFRGVTAMVSGGFDPIHAGHVEYFRAAASLGAPVLCNISPDHFVARKHPPLLPQAERAQIIDALRWVDITHLAPGPTVDDLVELQPRFFVKGADWRGRLPSDEMAACEEHGIEVVYLDTVINSSTAILRAYEAQSLTPAPAGGDDG